jgi:SAM-dependent methyltransferase
MTALDLETSDQVVEFGCGNGRDSLFFSRCGARVLALDASEAAIDHARDIGSKLPSGSIEFDCCDVADSERLSALVGKWTKPGARTIFYARFFLHSIDEDKQDALLRFIKGRMGPNDRLYLEFRTSLDASGPKEFGQHYRRYIDFEQFAATLAGLGFEITYSVEGRGMAVFRGEDAFVGRFVARATA